MEKQNKENNKIYAYKTTAKQYPNEQNKISNNTYIKWWHLNFETFFQWPILTSSSNKLSLKFDKYPHIL